MKTYFCIFILVAFFFQSTVALLETQDIKKNVLETESTGIIQQLLRKSIVNSSYCPPEQSKTYCSGNQPCCKYGSKYGCCPYSYGTCCGDGTCVPSGGQC